MSLTPDPTQSSRSSRRPRWWAWHQRMGLAFAVVFLVVIFTGIALNHTGGLGLDRKIIRAGWLYDWYGIELNGEPVAFRIGEQWIVNWDGRLAFQDRVVGAAEALRGAVVVADQSVIVLTDELWILTPDGDVIERLNSASLPEGELLRLGTGVGSDVLVLETDEGRFISSAELMRWTEIGATAEVSWAEPTALAKKQRTQLSRVLRGEDLTLYRIILDLHSGRFFGRGGVWVVDASALALAFLTVSGTWYALRIKRRS